MFAGLVVGLPVLGAAGAAAGAAYAAALRRDQVGVKAREAGAAAAGWLERAKELSKEYKVEEHLTEAAKVRCVRA